MAKRIGRIGRRFSSQDAAPLSSSRRRASSGWSNRSNGHARSRIERRSPRCDSTPRTGILVNRWRRSSIRDSRQATRCSRTEPVSVEALKDHSRAHVGGYGRLDRLHARSRHRSDDCGARRGALDRAAEGALLARIAVHVGVRTAVRRSRSRRTARGRPLRRARSGAPRGAGRARGRARSRCAATIRRGTPRPGGT